MSTLTVNLFICVNGLEGFQIFLGGAVIGQLRKRLEPNYHLQGRVLSKKYYARHVFRKSRKAVVVDNQHIQDSDYIMTAEKSEFKGFKSIRRGHVLRERIGHLQKI